MRTIRSAAAIAVYSFATSALGAVPSQKPFPLITIGPYQCGIYSVFSTGIQASADDVTNESVLFVVGGKNTYTLTQLSTAAAEAAHVDDLWQCSAASADSGCTMKAEYIVNGSHTPNTLRLRVGGATMDCTKTKSAYIRTQVVTTDKPQY